MNKKGFASVAVVVILAALVLGIGWYAIRSGRMSPAGQKEPTPDAMNATTSWKTYSNAQYGFEFKYPEKLSVSAAGGGTVNISHSIPFENRDGGCDMKGDAELSKTLNDFDLSIRVVPGRVGPPYVDGNYSIGALNGVWSYMGAEGCGQTSYYFPITGSRTLVATKSEVQILSDVVTPEIKARVLAVPGVITREEAKTLLDQIFSTFKLIQIPLAISNTGKSTTNQLIAESKVLETLKAKWQSIQATIPFRPEHPGTKAWIGPYGVQFIGNNNVLISFEDGYNPGLAVFNNFENGNFRMMEAFKNQSDFAFEDWRNLINKYGNPTYPVSTYTVSVVRNKELVSFSELTNVPENIFVKNY